MDHRSLWQKTQSDTNQIPTLKADLNCDVVVVGAGLTGVLTAWMLQERGFDVVALDSGLPGQGTTAHTTAKITALHGFFYTNLIASYGIDAAKLYYQANQSAIERYETLIKAQKISCDFQKVNGFLYTRSSPSKIQDEISALKALGAQPHFTTDTQLPFSVPASLKLCNQAIFHPLTFLNALLPHLRILGHCTVRKISNGSVICDHAAVTAKHIIIATRYPFFLVPGFFFARMHQERSYALSIANVSPTDDMYISADKNGIAFRPWNGQMILSGFSHRTGENQIQNGYEALQLYARSWYPGFHLTARWSAEDCISASQLPYIGSYDHKNSTIHVATGFHKWGMSSAMIAAEILTDTICGTKNRFAPLFSPHRFPSAKAFGNIIRDSGISTANLTKQIFYIPKSKLDHITPGQGGIILYKGKKAGVFHHTDGTYYFVSTRCPHMGCQLNWNQAECTWDCPCHGSRFSYDGTPLDPPANRALLCTRQKE